MEIIIRLWLKITAYRLRIAFQKVKLLLNRLKIENFSLMYFSEFSDFVVKALFLHRSNFGCIDFKYTKCKMLKYMRIRA